MERFHKQTLLTLDKKNKMLMNRLARVFDVFAVDDTYQSAMLKPQILFI